MLVCIGYKRTKRSTRSLAVEIARHYLRHILFFSLCRGLVLLRRSSCHKLIYLVKVDALPRRYIIHNNAYCRAVALTENGKAYIVVPC